MKKKVIKTICLGIFGAIFVATGLLWVGSVEAVEAQDDGLIVEYWTGTEWKKWLPGEESFPIFKEENFLPGDTVTRQVRVTNNSGQPQRIATEAINWPGFPNPEDMPDKDLSRALEITIREKEGSDLYGGSTGKKTLFDFYTKNGFNSTYEHVLTWGLPDGSEVIYEFEISFPSDKKNEWQGATTTFDILIGFQGTEGEESGGAGGAGGAGGGGGVGLPPGLTILSATSTVAATSTTITWTTNYFSTSQVVYSRSDQPHTLDLNAPNYGYASSTPEDLNKVTFHSVTITDLTPDTTYYYRCISHASPPTISREFSFKTLPLEKPLEKKEKPKELLETKSETKATLSALSRAIFKAKKEEFVAKEKPEIRTLVKKETLEEKTKKIQESKIEERKEEKEKEPSISYKDETAKKSNRFLAFLKNFGFGWLIVLIIILLFGIAVYYLNKKRS